MSLIQHAIPNLAMGVSQQPSSYRKDTQSKECINAWSGVVRGLEKRPSTEFIAKISAAIDEHALVHIYERDSKEKYIIIIKSGGVIESFDLETGLSNTVTLVVPSDYINVTYPNKELKVVTIADNTFIVNTSKQTLLDAYVSSGTIKTTVQTFGKLPSIDDPDLVGVDIPVAGDIFEIAGDAENDFDSYYVEFDGAVYFETVKPNQQNRLNSSTMPHKLVSEADGSFSYDVILWEERISGDDDRIPAPSFIDNTINDIFFYRNRLGFISKDNAVFSGAGDFFNFFGKSAQAILDDDAIDLSVQHNKVSHLNHAVPFNKTLLLFSDNVQFQLDAQEALTPATVRADVSTEFASSKTCVPIGSGNNIYFSSNYGDSSVIREYFISPDTITNDAGDITAHIPSYIPKNVKKLITSEQNDFIIALIEKSNEVYVYNFMWSGSEKIQSAWHKWVFSEETEVLSAEVFQNNIYFILAKSDGVYLEKMNIELTKTEVDLPISILLDRKTNLTGIYSSVTNKTTFTFPYQVQASEEAVAVLSGGFVGKEGLMLNLTEVSNNQYEVSGNYSSSSVYAGVNYNFSYTFSEFFVRDNDSVPIDFGRLQLRNLSLRYSDTAYFDVVVEPLYREPEYQSYRNSTLQAFTANNLGGSETIVGGITLGSGDITVPVLSDSTKVKITINNNTYRTCSFQSAAWEGIATNRSKRI